MERVFRVVPPGSQARDQRLGIISEPSSLSRRKYNHTRCCERCSHSTSSEGRKQARSSLRNYNIGPYPYPRPCRLISFVRKCRFIEWNGLTVSCGGGNAGGGNAGGGNAKLDL